jgi:hypothetical protein
MVQPFSRVIELDMKPSRRTVVFILAILIWLVIGWPFARNYHPIAEGLFNLVFILGVIMLPILLVWLDRRNPHH